MSNTYLTSNLISKEAVALFGVMNSFIATGYRKYENMFSDATYKPGDTINVRLDNFYVGSRGDVVTAEDIVEASIPIQIRQLYSVPIAYTPTDLQRKIADFSDEILTPAVRRIVAMMNKDIALAALTQVTYWEGDPSSNLNSFASLDQVNPIMDNLAMDSIYKRYASLNPTQVQQLRSAASLQNSFLPMLNKDITMDAKLGHLAGFDIFKDQSLTGFIAGTHQTSGTITVLTAVSSGNQITVTGLTPSIQNIFQAGDPISITGTFEFNPITRAPTSRAMQFAVQANASSDGSGHAVLTVSPTIQFTGPRQNIYSSTNQIPAGAVVNVVGNHLPNVAYTERGLVTCMPPLAPMDSPMSSVSTDTRYGVSMRVSKSAEVMNNKNILRLDGQLAFSWVPGQAIKVITSV